MNRSLPLLALLVGLLSFHAAVAEAQSAARRPVRRGDVTGLELQLEGALVAPRGGKLRWLMNVYEVVGLQDLRPAAGARIRVLTSLTPEEAAAAPTTDRNGRALAEFDIPEDAPASFRAVIEISAPVGVQRRFELSVRTTPARALSLHATATPVEGAVFALGRLTDSGGQQGLADVELELTFHDSRGPVGEPVRVRTDGAGLFTHRFDVPEGVSGQVRVAARSLEPTGSETPRVSAQATSVVQGPQSTALLVAVSPAQVVVAPQTAVPVDIVVRRPDGRPVPDAVLQVSRVPRPREAPPVVTDARGRARVVWRAPSQDEGHSDTAISVTAARTGLGSGQGRATVRVTRERWAGRVTIDGGGLSAELGGRIYAQVTSIDGQRVGAGVGVRVTGPRLPQAGLAAETDADGVATFEVELGRQAAAGADRCGGDAATAMTVRIGEGRVRTIELCAPVDPDAAARVRVASPLVTAGQPVHVEVVRARAAARLPVALTFLDVHGSELRAISSQVLSARQSRVEVTLPAGVSGRVLVRARPLAGRAQQEVRGGEALLFVSAGPRSGVTASFDGAERSARVELVGPAGPRSVRALALPVDAALALSRQLRGASPFGDARRPMHEVGDALAAAMLAPHVPVDLGASSLLRGRELVPVPAPTNPAQLGLLRDPWRARDRFVGGRLALLFRAIEEHVEQQVPTSMDTVAIEQRGRFRFNSQLMASLAAGGLGSEGATGLGGEPLTIEQLARLDRGFTYDNVAKRITRERLFRLLLALRQFVRSNDLDLPWARRGEPSGWLRQILGHHVAGAGRVNARDLVDGWGRPFELRPVRGRARFDRVQPIAGYEVVSPGPDGRVGNGDDLVDPTARVLPSGGLYAEAVGEDALVARLTGVELGRATVQMAASIFGVGFPSIRAPNQGSRQHLTSFGTLPAVIETDRWALALRRPAHPGVGVHASPGVVRGATSLAMPVDEEARTWGVVVESYTPAGFHDVVVAIDRAGAPLLTDGVLPWRLRVDEALAVELSLTNVIERDLALSVNVEAEGVEVEVPRRIELPSGEARTLPVQLVASQPGRGSLTLRLTDAEGRLVRRVRRAVVVDRGLHPYRRRGAGLVLGEAWELELEVPDDAQDISGRLVVLAPNALTADADLADVRQTDPGLIAWADALSGHGMAPALRSELLRSQQPNGTVAGPMPALSTACALIALAAEVDDAEAAAAAQRASRVVTGLGPFPDRDGQAGRLRMKAAVLAALAVSGVSDVADPSECSSDPLGAQLALTLPELRRALRDVPGEPSLLARAAGALLLVDPDDGHGRAMLARALRRTRERGDDLIVVPSEDRTGPLEAATATLALAIAAHQIGDGETAARLLRGALHDTPLIMRAGGEATFWLLAAGAYGALGVTPPSTIEVSVDGTDHSLALEGGVGVLPLALGAGDDVDIEIETEEGVAVLARAEVVFGRPFEARRDGPLGLSMQGDVGHLGGIAALELTVSAAAGVDDPILDIQLPAGVQADEQLLAGLRSSSVVRLAEARSPGFVRLTLAPLAAESRTAVSLPLPWRASGRVRGLAVVAYPGDRPHAMTVLPSRVLDVTPEPTE